VADIVNSLFGVDPAALQQQRSVMDSNQAFRFAQLSPMERATMSIYQGGAGLGRAATQLLGGDEQLNRATQIRQLASQFDFSDPDSIDQFAQQVSALNPQIAAEAAQRAASLRLSGAKTVKESALAQRALREKEGPSYRPLTSAEVRARGLNPNSSYQLEEGTNKVVQIGQGPAVVFNAPLVGSEKAYAGKVGVSAAERDIAQFGAAENAVENLNKINETLNQLKTGDAFTGAFADVQTNLQKVQAKFASDKKAGKRVSDTEYLDALLGSDVFPMISSLGIGARGLDTPAERDFLRQVMTGRIGLEKDTIVRLTELRKNIAERAIDKFNDRVEKGELNRFFEYQGTEPRKFEKPKAPVATRQPGQPPAGIDARIWNALTPEEQALWK
jgi:hypothetical protein